MKQILFLYLFSFSFFAMAADPLPTSRPESAGLSPEKLANIEKVLRADIEKGRIPGAVVAIARKGRLVYYEAFGYTDKEAGTPMTKDAIFAIASMTKPMVGVAIMQMMEETRLQMSDPVSRWFPELGKLPVGVVKGGAMESVPARRPMTVQDLLRHTSGLTYGGRGSTPMHKSQPASSGASAARYSSAEFIEALGKSHLLYQPGTTWDYGLSIDVLGLILEAEHNQKLSAILSERIWKPLGMVDTGFLVPADKVKRYARALRNDPDTGKPQASSDRTKPDKFECGGGCAASTAGDYIRFGQMLLNRGQLGGQRILASRTVDYMTANHLTRDMANYVADADPTKAGYEFGLTMAVRTSAGGPAMMGSPGVFTWSGASGTDFWVDPKEQLVVVFMSAGPGAIRWHYRRLINALVYQSLVD
ncbi:MAG: serine hydrolase domain-containing protein [Burkholderiales bacterium]